MGHIGLIETGERRPSYDKVEAIADALRATDDERARLQSARIDGGPSPATSGDASFSVDEKLAKLTPEKRAAVMVILDGLLAE
jgi:transcriptional regulator with XRE-family HTH domain